jgi:hypothetical protein
MQSANANKTYNPTGIEPTYFWSGGVCDDHCSHNPWRCVKALFLLKPRHIARLFLGWPYEFVKKSPINVCSPTNFLPKLMHKLNQDKIAQKCGLFNIKKLPYLMGENSPNLVTLFISFGESWQLHAAFYICMYIGVIFAQHK